MSLAEYDELINDISAEAIKEVFCEIESKCIDTFGNFNYKAFVGLKNEMVGESK